MASMSSCSMAAAGAAGGGGGGGGGGAALAGAGAGAGSAGLAGAFAGGLVASSSAMIRRMEARISSIEGSWAFAACVIRRILVKYRAGKR
jgi:hypothetical protein